MRIRAQLPGQLRLAGTAGHGRDPVPEPGGVLQAQVAEPADALDRDQRARPGAGGTPTVTTASTTAMKTGEAQVGTW
jgi:hypothetical protein